MSIELKIKGSVTEARILDSRGHEMIQLRQTEVHSRIVARVGFNGIVVERENAADLAKLLQRFADTGTLAEKDGE